MRTRDYGVRPVVVCALVTLTPLAVAAQPSSSASQSHGQGPMKVEVQRSGAVIAPDVKLTEVDGDFRTLVGAYAGWLNDGTWFIGGAGYWLATGDYDRGMAYGGLIVQWLTGTNRRVTFGAKGLMGGGQAHLATTVTYPGRGFGWDHRPPFGGPSTTAARVIYDQGFFVAEPQVDLIVNITPAIRFGVGGGYRIIGAAGGWEHRLRGATGSISVQIGGS